LEPPCHFPLFIERQQYSDKESIVKHWFRWRSGCGAMVSITSRLGASSMFAEIDQEIAPDQPNIERLIAIATRHGLTACAG